MINEVLWYSPKGILTEKAQGIEHYIILQDCFLQKEARVCVSNAFVLDDSMFK